MMALLGRLRCIIPFSSLWKLGRGLLVVYMSRDTSQSQSPLYSGRIEAVGSCKNKFPRENTDPTTWLTRQRSSRWSKKAFRFPALISSPNSFHLSAAYFMRARYCCVIHLFCDGNGPVFDITVALGLRDVVRNDRCIPHAQIEVEDRVIEISAKCTLWGAICLMMNFFKKRILTISTIQERKKRKEIETES